MSAIYNGEAASSVRSKLNAILSVAGTYVTLAGAEVLTNKDLTSATNTFPTSLVTLDDTQVLTNKTLTSPVITGPTGIVKGDVGLGNVDNTSDATKNAASVTLTNKTLTSPVINSPTGIVKGDVGLGNCDNTSDVNKPISTLQQAALDLKQNANAKSTLIEDVRAIGTGYTIAAADMNRLQRVTLAAPGTVTIPEQSTIPTFLVGAHHIIVNLAASGANDITLSTSGSATLETLNGTTTVIASGEAACLVPVSTTGWLRLW